MIYLFTRNISFDRVALILILTYYIDEASTWLGILDESSINFKDRKLLFSYANKRLKVKWGRCYKKWMLCSNQAILKKLKHLKRFLDESLTVNFLFPCFLSDRSDDYHNAKIDGLRLL